MKKSENKFPVKKITFVSQAASTRLYFSPVCTVRLYHLLYQSHRWLLTTDYEYKLLLCCLVNVLPVIFRTLFFCIEAK
jgi:hypothetical protein